MRTTTAIAAPRAADFLSTITRFSELRRAHQGRSLFNHHEFCSKLSADRRFAAAGRARVCIPELCDFGLRCLEHVAEAVHRADLDGGPELGAKAANVSLDGVRGYVL